MKILRVKQEFTAINTPEQNGYMESFQNLEARIYLDKRLPKFPRSLRNHPGSLRRLQPAQDTFHIRLPDTPG